MIPTIAFEIGLHIPMTLYQTQYIYSKTCFVYTVHSLPGQMQCFTSELTFTDGVQSPSAHQPHEHPSFVS